MKNYTTVSDPTFRPRGFDLPRQCDPRWTYSRQDGSGRSRREVGEELHPRPHLGRSRRSPRSPSRLGRGHPSHSSLSSTHSASRTPFPTQPSSPSRAQILDPTLENGFSSLLICTHGKLHRRTNAYLANQRRWITLWSQVIMPTDQTF